MKLNSEEAMKLAISEAYKGAAKASPNPLVGAVLIDAAGQLLSSGYHEFFGGPHAEVQALKGLRPEQLKGATLYVTLEPCAHEGKTPSCAKMLAKLPLKKVVYGLMDPNPLVAGQGAEILSAAGIETEVYCETHPELKVSLEEVCEAFLWNYRQKKVFVSLKIAQSLDGQMALKGGESKWITNEKSREHVHYLRACHDAVMVGRRTLEKDNPSLNIRHPQIEKTNKVIVIDPNGALLARATELNILSLHKPENLFWCLSEKHLPREMPGFAQVLKIKENPQGTLDLESLLSALWRTGIRSVMIEGGALTASRFLAANLVNRLYIFQAPVVLGAQGGRSWTEEISIPEMRHRRLLQNAQIKYFEGDILITGRLM